MSRDEGGAEHRPAGETAKKDADRTAGLIKEVGELIQLLKGERQEKRSGVPAKESIPESGSRR